MAGRAMTTGPYVHDEPDNTVLIAGPRHTTPITDEVVLSVRHRTTRTGRSALLPRPDVVELHAWLTAWLNEGWDGVPRTCQHRYREPGVAEWLCDQAPGHFEAHEGPATGWSSALGRPGRFRWPRSVGAPAAATTTDRLRCLHAPMDSGGFCAEDGFTWPCRTARILNGETL